MTSTSWEQWTGHGYPAEKLNSTTYYYPSTVDIEDEDNLAALVTEMHLDGVVPTKSAARELLDSAIVIHGQVVDDEGELYCYFGPKHGPEDNGYHVTHDATWVEVDEYDE